MKRCFWGVLVLVLLASVASGQALPRPVSDDQVLTVRWQYAGHSESLTLALDELEYVNETDIYTLDLAVQTTLVDEASLSVLLAFRADQVVARVDYAFIVRDPWTAHETGLYPDGPHPGEVLFTMELADIELPAGPWRLHKGVDSHSCASLGDVDGCFIRSPAADPHEGITTWWARSPGGDFGIVIGGLRIASCDTEYCALTGTVTVTDWPMPVDAVAFRQTAVARCSDWTRHSGRSELRVKRIAGDFAAAGYDLQTTAAATDVALVE